MKTITLTKGYVATVDDDDYERLSKFKWTAVVNGKFVKRIYGYRRAGWDKLTRRYTRTVWMHREIANPPYGMDVDHINRNTLDNRKANLRFATRSQNLANNRRPIGATGYRGVTRSVNGEKALYFAQISVNGKREYLGGFFDKAEAARAYDAAALKAFGEFARLNFPI